MLRGKKFYQKMLISFILILVVVLGASFSVFATVNSTTSWSEKLGYTYVSYPSGYPINYEIQAFVNTSVTDVGTASSSNAQSTLSIVRNSGVDNSWLQVKNIKFRMGYGVNTHLNYFCWNGSCYATGKGLTLNPSISANLGYAFYDILSPINIALNISYEGDHLMFSNTRTFYPSGSNYCKNASVDFGSIYLGGLGAETTGKTLNVLMNLSTGNSSATARSLSTVSQAQWEFDVYDTMSGSTVHKILTTTVPYKTNV